MNLEAMGMKTAKINQFHNKGVASIEELVRMFPKRYLDFIKQHPINQASDEPILVGGTIKDISVRNKNLAIQITDELSDTIGYLTLFGQAFLAKKFEVGEALFVGGKITHLYDKYFIMPVMWSKQISDIQGIQPIYSKIKGMSDDFLKNAIGSGLTFINKNDFLEPQLLDDFDLVPLHKSLRGLHYPTSIEQLKDSQKRYLFDELFLYNFHLMNRPITNNSISPYVLEDLSKTAEFLKRLSFDLTDGQKEVLRGITRKMKNNQLVDALVMGDVGCGKTLVALLLMLGQAENGFQSVLVAPTNVLAIQHFNEAKLLLEPLGITVGFINGGLKVRERKKLLKDLQEGKIDILIGTHACMNEDVLFGSLSLAIVDEEHRFGVKQREAIRHKVSEGIHMVSMSATPIPRSLAVTLYGEHISVHTIKSMPSGRKPVKISLHQNGDAPYRKIIEAVSRGEQAYIVCPLIEENETESMKEVKSVEQMYNQATEEFSKHGIVVDYISGNMKEEEINMHLTEFKEGRTHVLVSTTVIEVGVNVPNATVIIIENAERFGASQLWQLKGRVGRGDKSSNCYLVSPNPNPLSKQKLEMICRVKDGFEVAKEDLKLRGAGSLLGEQQSGGNRYIELMLQHSQFNEKIRETIKEIMANPQRLKRYKKSLQPQGEIVEK